MTIASEFRPDIAKIAVGIIADADSVSLLHQTVQNASELSDRVFVLAVGNNVKINESSATVVHGGWDNDDAATRNFLIDAVEEANVAEYLLWMNPGETFDSQTLDAFQEFLEDDISQDAIYMMVLHRLVRDDKKRDDFDEETIDLRLMPLNKGIRYQGTVHASLLERNAAMMIQISAAPGRFIAPSKRLDPLKSKKRAEKTLRQIDKLENEGTVLADALLLYQAEALLLLENYAPARRVYRQLIKETQRNDLRLAAYYGLWETAVKAPMPDADITDFLVKALDTFPVDMQLLTFLGSHLLRVGKLELAVRAFETALEHGQITLDVGHRLRIKEIAITSLALTFRLLGKNREAIDMLESHYEQIEDKSDFARHLLDLYIQENELSSANDLAATIWGDAALDQMRLVFQGACLAKQGDWSEALDPLTEAYDAGCRDVLCLRWYALTLFSQKNFDKAKVIIDQWLAVEPNNVEAKSYKSAATQPDNFCNKLRSDTNRVLKTFGVPASNLVAKRMSVSIDDAVKEMMQSSASTGGSIKGFQSVAKPVAVEG